MTSTTATAQINLQVGGGVQNVLHTFTMHISEDAEGKAVYTPSVIDGLAGAIRAQADLYRADGGEQAWLDEMAKWAFAQASDERAQTSAFEQNVRRITTDLAELLIEKNAAYGNAALDPVRTFSKASPEEQLLVRIDDKLSRIARGHEYQGDDTVKDLCGYLVLLLIAREGA